MIEYIHSRAYRSFTLCLLSIVGVLFCLNAFINYTQDAYSVFSGGGGII